MSDCYTLRKAYRTGRLNTHGLPEITVVTEYCAGKRDAELRRDLAAASGAYEWVHVIEPSASEREEPRYLRVEGRTGGETVSFEVPLDDPPRLPE